MVKRPSRLVIHRLRVFAKKRVKGRTNNLISVSLIKLLEDFDDE